MENVDYLGPAYGGVLEHSIKAHLEICGSLVWSKVSTVTSDLYFPRHLTTSDFYLITSLSQFEVEVNFNSFYWWGGGQSDPAVLLSQTNPNMYGGMYVFSEDPHIHEQNL